MTCGLARKRSLPSDLRRPVSQPLLTLNKASAHNAGSTEAARSKNPRSPEVWGDRGVAWRRLC